MRSLTKWRLGITRLGLALVVVVIGGVLGAQLGASFPTSTADSILMLWLLLPLALLIGWSNAASP